MMQTRFILIASPDMARKILAAAVVSLAITAASGQNMSSPSTTSVTRPRASDLGLKVGILRAGPLNAITDVAGVVSTPMTKRSRGTPKY